MNRTHADVATQAEEYLTTQKVSDETGIPIGTLRYWRHRGDQGPASFTLGKKRVVYKRSSLEAWLATQEASVRGGVA